MVDTIDLFLYILLTSTIETWPKRSKINLKRQITVIIYFVIFTVTECPTLEFVINNLANRPVFYYELLTIKRFVLFRISQRYAILK